MKQFPTSAGLIQAQIFLNHTSSHGWMGLGGGWGREVGKGPSGLRADGFRCRWVQVPMGLWTIGVGTDGAREGWIRYSL